MACSSSVMSHAVMPSGMSGRDRKAIPQPLQVDDERPLHHYLPAVGRSEPGRPVRTVDRHVVGGEFGHHARQKRALFAKVRTHQRYVRHGVPQEARKVSRPAAIYRILTGKVNSDLILELIPIPESILERTPESALQSAPESAPELALESAPKFVPESASCAQRTGFGCYMEEKKEKKNDCSGRPGDVARERPLARVDALVLGQVVLPVELAAAHVAPVPLVDLVLARVPDPVVLPDELAATVIARVRPDRPVRIDSDSRTNALGQYVHWNGFIVGFVCVHLCCFRFQLVVNRLLQMPHAYAIRSLVCVSRWRRMLVFVYGCWQMLHGSVLFSSFAYLSVWDSRMWRVKLLRCMNFSRQYGHDFGFFSCVSLCHSILAIVWNTSPHSWHTYSSFTTVRFRW
uniref:Uncharacterized protein n=1 Tax=Anopheles coluzzii TaxID=1518534 RepID=A0A8W7PYF6_ANOCL